MPFDPALAAAYWTAVHGDEIPLPELPEDAADNPVASFLALIESPGEAGAGFRQLKPLVADPYPGIALAENPGAEMEVWAAEVAGLIPFTTPALQEYVLFLDTVADPAGNHRIYPFVEGAAADDIASIADALPWMTAVVRYARHDCEWAEVEAADAALPEAEPWEWSGAEVFCHLRDLPLPDAFQAWSMRSWPELELRSTLEIDAEQAGAARIAMLATVEKVLRVPKAGIRGVRASQLPDTHRKLLALLKDLAAAVVAERPPRIVVEAAQAGDPRIVALAKEWLARFEAAGAGGQVDASLVLRKAVAAAVAHLEGNGAIEVAENAHEQLVEELALTAFDASNAKQLLRKLRGALFASDHVVDVYADDLSLETVFREALGG